MVSFLAANFVIIVTGIKFKTLYIGNVYIVNYNKKINRVNCRTTDLHRHRIVDVHISVKQ